MDTKLRFQEALQWEGPGWYASSQRSYAGEQYIETIFLDDYPDAHDERRSSDVEMFPLDADISHKARLLGLGTPIWLENEPDA